MNVVRHAGYLEVEMPEFFDLAHHPERLILIFSSFQGGHEKLLLDISRSTPPAGRPDRDQIAHCVQSLLNALENTRDTVAMLAFLTSKAKVSAVQPYVDQLEANGYETRLFSDQQKALLWLGI